MSTEKPSRNEGGYFALQNAELLRQQREKLAAAAAEAERKTHYMKCPKDGYDLVSSEYPRRADRDLSPLRRRCGSTPATLTASPTSTGRR